MACAQAVVALLLMAVAEATPPDPSPATVDGWLEWATADRSDSCVDARGFADQVERSLGRSPLAAAHDAQLTIVARIERASPVGPVPRWSGEIRVRDAQGRWIGSRTIAREGGSCRPLGDALALATALVLSQEDAAESAPSPVAVPETPAKIEPAAPRPQDSAPPESAKVIRPPEASARAVLASPAARPRGFRVGVEAGLSTAVGLLPEPSLGVTVSAFLVFANDVKVFATGGAWSQQVVSTGTGHGVTLKLISLGAGICPLGRAWRGFSGDLCARVDVGRLRATGFGFTLSGSGDRPTVDAGAGFEVRRALLGPVYASISAGLAVPFVRDRISYADNGGATIHPIFRPSVLAGMGELRLGATF